MSPLSSSSLNEQGRFFSFLLSLLSLSLVVVVVVVSPSRCHALRSPCLWWWVGAVVALGAVPFGWFLGCLSVCLSFLLSVLLVGVLLHCWRCLFAFRRWFSFVFRGVSVVVSLLFLFGWLRVFSSGVCGLSSLLVLCGWLLLGCFALVCFRCWCLLGCCAHSQVFSLRQFPSFNSVPPGRPTPNTPS